MKKNNVWKCMHYLVRRLGKHSFLPEIRGQVAVSLWDRVEGGLGCNERQQFLTLKYPRMDSCVLKRFSNKPLTKVAQSGSAAPGRCVAVIDTSHHQQFLGHGSRHNAGTTGSGNETHQDWTTATGHLTKHMQSINMVQFKPSQIKPKTTFKVSPCTALYVVFRSCYPSILFWREWWTVWPGWWLHE